MPNNHFGAFDAFDVRTKKFVRCINKKEKIINKWEIGGASQFCNE